MTDSYRLLGVDFAPSRADAAGFEKAAEQARAALAGPSIDPTRLPKPRPAAQPVFADAAGRPILLVPTPDGLAAVPYVPGDPLGPTGDPSAGGFATLDELRDRADAAPGPVAGDPVGYPALKEAALAAYAKSGGKGGGGGPLAGLGQSVGMGVATALFRKGVEELGKTGSVGALLSAASAFDIGKAAKDLGFGAVQQIAGMATSMAFNALWAVDDTSGVAEQVAHQYAGEALSLIQSEVTNQALAALEKGLMPDLSLSGLGDGLLARVQKFFGIPAERGGGFAALRVGDKDPKANAILTGSADVFIEGPAAARLCDRVDKTGAMVYRGSGTVLISGQPAGRITESLSKDGPFPAGAAKTFIGGPSVGLYPPPELPPVGADAVSAATGAAGGSGRGGGKPPAAAGGNRPTAGGNGPAADAAASGACEAPAPPADGANMCPAPKPLLVAIDGTGSRAFEESGRNTEAVAPGRIRSHVRNFYDDFPGEPGEDKLFLHGPTTMGLDTGEIRQEALDWLSERLAEDPDRPVYLIGHSRGGYDVIELARDLQAQGIATNNMSMPSHVQWLGALDPVDMTPNENWWSPETIPANVRNATVILASPTNKIDYHDGHFEVQSRSWWDRHYAGAEDPAATDVNPRTIHATHAGLGGDPGDYYPMHLTHTQESDMRGAVQADQIIRHDAQQAGAPIPSVDPATGYGYRPMPPPAGVAPTWPREMVRDMNLPGEVTYTRPHVNNSDPWGPGAVHH